MRLLLLSSLLLSLLVASPLLAQSSPIREASASSSEKCRRVVLSEGARPSWTLSGTWITPEELVLVDAVDNELVRLDVHGRLISKGSTEVELAVKERFEEKFLPVSMHAAKGGAWLELIGTRFVKLTSANEVADTRDLWGVRIEPDAKLIAILGWALADGEVFGFGDYRLDYGERKTGFFRANLEDMGDSRVLSLMPDGDTTQLWYRLGNPYVTSLDSVGYALKFAERLQIVKNAPASESLELVGSFTGPLRNPPELPPFKTPDDLIAIMEELSSSTVPIALRGWNDKLYLLWRYTTEERESWVVSRIDPDEPKLEGSAFLPSSGAHLMLIPGPEYWAVVEKGPVRGYGVQTTSSILFVPSSEVTRAFASGSAICG